MRDAFHEELDRLSDQLVEMTRFAASAIDQATTALLEADLGAAEAVISADTRLDHMRDELDELGVQLLARQQPVATDLRIVVTAIHMSSSLERMGDLAEHVAKIARLRFPEHAVPDELRETITEMSRIAQRLALRAGEIIGDKDIDAARSFSADDDEMDALHRKVFTTVADGAWTHSAERTADAILLSRFYERFGDHAVSLARQVVYLVTGERKQHHDAGVAEA